MAISGNYIDNAIAEWTNEYDVFPDFGPNEYSFGGLSISGNHFTVKRVLSDYAFPSIRPYGRDHHIHGLTVSNNVFLVIGPKIQRIDKVDTTFADLDYSRMRNVMFDGNNFNGVLDYVANPIQITHTQSTAQASWVVPLTNCLPFGAWAKNVDSVVAVSIIQNAVNAYDPRCLWCAPSRARTVRTCRSNGHSPPRADHPRPHGRTGLILPSQVVPIAPGRFRSGDIFRSEGCRT